MKPRLVALVAGVLVLGACSDTSFEEANAERTQGGSKAVRTYELSEEGFSLSIPAEWKAATARDLLSGEQLESFREENPELAPYLEAVTAPDSLIRFFAYDPDVEGDFAANLNVVVLEVGSAVSFERWAAAAVAEVRRLPTLAGTLEERRETLPAGPALRLAYEQSFRIDGSTRTVATAQVGFVGNGKAYVLTLTALPEQRAAYEDELRSAAESFRLTR